MPKLTTDNRYQLREQYSSSNDYYPDLLPQDFTYSDLPENLATVPYRNPRNNEKLVTMYNYDYHIDVCWNFPNKALSRLKTAWGTMTPDYSVQRDRLRGEHIMNIYRSRWVGRFLQQNGIRVIPHITFTDLASYDYCFIGIPTDQIIIIDAPSWTQATPSNLQHYLASLLVAIDRLQPAALLIHGNLRHLLQQLPNGLIVKQLKRFIDKEQFHTKKQVQHGA